MIYDTEKNNFENKESLVFIIKIDLKNNQIKVRKVKKDLEYEDKKLNEKAFVNNRSINRSTSNSRVGR